MVNLNEILASLFTDMTIARVKTDIETVNISHLYSTDSLLKHMPIPHMRLKKVTIKLPIIINDIQQSEKNIGQNKTWNPILDFIHALENDSKLSDIKNMSKTLNIVVNDIKKIMSNNTNTSVIKDIINYLDNDFQSLRKDKEWKSHTQYMSLNIKKSILTIFDSSAIDVTIATSHIKEYFKNVNDVNSVPIIEMIVDEEGLELTSWENDSGKHKGLVPE